MAHWLSEQSGAEVLKNTDWEKLDTTKLSQDEVNALEEPIAKLFSKYTKRELEEIAEKTRAMVVPVRNVEDVVKSEHLVNRDYWVELEHPESGGSIRYPAHPFISSETKIQPRFRAPLVGEHNQQVYEKELGFTREEIKSLEEAGVI
jgi:crotonobetainyl-CoA:carnitine CoA-transferase CaiB-like acyl-CoA transferase